MSLVDYINQAIRRQTNLIGNPVRNLYGAVAGQSPAVLNQQDAVWLVLSIQESGLPSLDEFLNRYTNAPNKDYSRLTAVDGIVGVTGNYSSGASPTALLFRGVVDMPGPTAIPLGIVANGPGNAFAIYLDGVLQRSGTDTINQTLAMGSGKHVIEIVASATEIYIAVPASLRVYDDLDMVETPVWESASSGYLDSTTGTVGNTLRWYSSSRAGGWIVARREVTHIAPITTISPADKFLKFAVELSGDYTGQLTAGSEALAGRESIGTILSASYDSTADITTVALSLPLGLTAINALWTGRTLGTGRFEEQARFTRIGSPSGLVSWVDTAVVIGTVYDYILYAFSVFDQTRLSAASDIQTVATGDSTAPSSIVFASGYPQVFNGIATVKFTTPSEVDYAGVRVLYYENPISGTSSGSNNTGILNDTNKSMVVNQYAGYYLFITGNTGAGQTALIASNSTTQFVLDSSTPWQTGFVPDATSTYDVFQLVSVLTDYGVHSSLDSLVFPIIGEGVYHFVSFDYGNNVQQRLDGAAWIYDADDALAVPVTQIVVNDVTQGGQISNSALGIALFSIPKQESLFEETFTGPENYRLTGTLLTSGTSDASGNAVNKIIKTASGWTVDAFIGKKIRLVPTSGVFSGFVARIWDNDADEIWFTPSLPIAPNSVAFEVLDNFPNVIDPSVLNTTGDRWTTSGANGIVTQDALWFTGTLNTEYTIYLNSAYSGTGTPVRLAATIGRATTHASGTNLTYRGSSNNGNRWEYGIVHSSDSVVIPRYRYNSGGKGTWTNMPGLAWSRYAANQLIVEIDGDIHTFRWSDAYGHNERFVGRVTGTAGPLDTRIGWNVRGQSGGDNIDDLHMLDYSKLVRLKYRLLPNHQSLKVTQFFGQATSGSTTSLNDTAKAWYTNELIGMRVLITGGPGLGSDRGILSNTATQLIPDTAFSAAVTSASTYIVYEDDYTGTESIQFWDSRDPSNPQTMEYHGERANIPPEPIKRVRVDPNQVPEVFLTVTKLSDIGTYNLVSVAVDPDDDVKSWSCYAKLTGWPTSDNTPSGVIDPAYLRWQNVPISEASKTLQLPDGTWFVVVIPYDSNNSPGPNVGATITVTNGGGGTGTVLSNVRANRVGSTNQIKISWDHTADIESPTSTHSLRLDTTNTMDGQTYMLTQALDPWSEGGGANTVSGSGYYIDSNWSHGQKNVDPYVSLRFDIQLVLDSTGQVLATYTAWYSFYGNYLA